MDTLVPNADLQVTKTDSPDPVTAGTDLTYTIDLLNAGPSDGRTVTVTDAVPPNTTFVSASVTTGSGWGIVAPPVGGSGNVVFSKGTVAFNETATFSIVVHVSASAASGSLITNSATAATTDVDPAPANNTGTATTTVQTSADLQVTKTDSPDPVTIGTNLTYTINLVNAGPSDSQTVTVTDAVPADTTFVSAAVTTGSGWTIAAPAVGGTGNVVFAKGTVALSETATFSMVVHVAPTTPGGYTLTNSAVAASATSDPNPANNTATATTTMVCPTTTLTASLPGGTVGTAYNQTVTASPAGTVYTYAVTAGALPPVLSLNGASGAITGMPTTPGNYSFTITATGWGGRCTGSQPYTIAVVCPTITLAPATLPGAVKGVFYSQAITGNGGTAPYTFAVTGGSLPPGITLSPGGLLSGTCLTISTYAFTVTATDFYGCSGSKAYTFSVYNAYFQDEALRAKVCVNFVTGAYAWQILSGPGVGVYTGVATVLNGGTKIYSKPGAADTLNVTYDPIRKRAYGYFFTAGGAYSTLNDLNTTNNVGGCP